MSYQTIDDIPATATSLSDSDKIEVRQSGQTKQSVLSVLLAYMQSALTFPSVPSLSTILAYVQANLTFPVQTVSSTNYTVTGGSPQRALNTVYQNLTGKPLEVRGTIEMATTLSLSGGQTATASFLSDSSSAPTTVRPGTKNGNTGSLTIGLNITQTIDVPLTYTVPAGHYYKIISGGTGTVTLMGWTEEVRT